MRRKPGFSRLSLKRSHGMLLLGRSLVTPLLLWATPPANPAVEIFQQTKETIPTNTEAFLSPDGTYNCSYGAGSLGTTPRCCHCQSFGTAAIHRGQAAVKNVPIDMLLRNRRLCEKAGLVEQASAKLRTEKERSRYCTDSMYGRVNEGVVPPRSLVSRRVRG